MRLRIVVSVAAWACGVVTVGVAVRVRLEMRVGVEELLGISVEELLGIPDAILVLVAVPDAVGVVVAVAVVWKVMMTKA